MEWSGVALGLAAVACPRCEGHGMVAGPRVRNQWAVVPVRVAGPPVPCRCALRAVFRSAVSVFRGCGREVREAGGGRVREEYRADFYSLARRHVEPGPDWDIVRWYVLQGVPMAAVAARLGSTVHACCSRLYRIEATLGRIFAETQPYALWPPGEYFGGAVHCVGPALLAPPELTRGQRRGVLRDRAVRDLAPAAA